MLAALVPAAIGCNEVPEATTHWVAPLGVGRAPIARQVPNGFMVVAGVTSPEEGIQMTRLTLSGEEVSSKRFAASVDDAVYAIDKQGNVAIVARGLDLSSCHLVSAKDDEFGLMLVGPDGVCLDGDRMSQAEVGVPVAAEPGGAGGVLLLSRSGEGATAMAHLEERHSHQQIWHVDVEGVPHAMGVSDWGDLVISYTAPNKENWVRRYESRQFVGEYQSPQNTLFTHVAASKGSSLLAGSEDGAPILVLLGYNMNVDWERRPLSGSDALVEPVSLVAGPELTVAFAVSGDDATVFDSTIPAGHTGVFDLAYDFGTPTPRTVIPSTRLTMVRPVYDDQVLIAGSLEPTPLTDPGAMSSGLDHPSGVYGALLLTNE
ncbi:MAG: hypothetical protein U0271_08380 [Polyangiaceae bacterium]